MDYKKVREDHLSNNNPRQVWHEIQQLTNFMGQTSTAVDLKISLAKELNMFFARFESTAL